ncbi:MAG: VOC family protein [Deltaproteobacteria bacterium]|nr:VOC family protein [Deltaproteobacteria bacterium]
MAFHHVAYGTRDLTATHEFYTRRMGFRLVKVVAAPTPGDRGWAKYLVYDTGNGQMIAFWDLHDPQIGDDWKADHAQSLGAPEWVNHVAFDAPTLDDLHARRKIWQESGIRVLEVDHEWCTSIYTTDPNGPLVEFCCTTPSFSAEEIAAASRLVHDPAPPLEGLGTSSVHEPITAGAAS